MRLGIKILFVYCLAINIWGCSPSKLNELNSNDVIVAFGDSLTEGVGTNEMHSYPSVLSRLSGLGVINAGVSGETTSEGLERLPKIIDEHNPSLVILLEGGNDILRGYTYQSIKQNLDNMIQATTSQNIPVVLIGVPEKRLFSNSAPFYEELADQYDLVFDDSIIGRLMRDPSMKSDPIHFNKQGYAELAEDIYALLMNHGAF